MSSAAIFVWYFRVNNTVKHLENAHGMANCVDPDQTAPFKEQSDWVFTVC